MGFLGGAVVKNSPGNVGDEKDTGFNSSVRKIPGEGNSNSLQYFCWENSTDRGAWWATVHRVAKSRT